MHKGFIRTAALLGALAVALGAFGAHGLKKYYNADVLQVYETAVRYQFYHVFALLAVGILYGYFPSAKMKWAGYLFIAGIIIFCGSLYLLSYLQYAEMDNMKWVGAITPLGGAAFIGGWVLIGLGIGKGKANW
jgi:uncharacterized membrane protein YgdD (TMEM256/DUF423 family)